MKTSRLMILHCLYDHCSRSFCMEQGCLGGNVSKHVGATFQLSPNVSGLTTMSSSGVVKSSSWLSLKFPQRPQVFPVKEESSISFSWAQELSYIIAFYQKRINYSSIKFCFGSGHDNNYDNKRLRMLFRKCFRMFFN